MTRLLLGVGFGFPLGMLLADWYSTHSAEDRIREVVRQDLAAEWEAASETAEVTDRVAGEAREGASRARETAVLNQVTREELLSVQGIGPKLAQKILDGRPYWSDREVVERKILNQATFEHLRRHVLAKRGNRLR